MKKIFTLMFFSVLFSAAAFAQTRYHRDDSPASSYQYQSNGYGNSRDHWKDDNVGFMDHSSMFQKRDWDDHRFMNDKESVIGRSRFYNDNYDRYRARKSSRFSLQIFFGEKHRF